MGEGEGGRIQAAPASRGRGSHSGTEVTSNGGWGGVMGWGGGTKQAKN